MHGVPPVSAEPSSRSLKRRAMRRLDAILREHAAHGAALPKARALAIFLVVAAAVDEAHRRGRSHGAVSLAAIAIEERTGRVVVAPPSGAFDRAADRAALLVVAEALFGKEVMERAASSCPEPSTSRELAAAMYRALGLEPKEGETNDERTSSSAYDRRTLRVLVLDADSARQAEAMRAVTAVYGSRVRVRTSDDGADTPHLAIVDGDRAGAPDLVAELRARAGSDRMRVVVSFAKPERGAWSMASLGVVDAVRHDDGDALKTALRAIGTSSGWRVRATGVEPSERRISRPEPLEEVEDEPAPPRRRRRSRSSREARDNLVRGVAVFVVASTAIFIAMALIARTSRRPAASTPPPVHGDIHSAKPEK